MNNSEQRIFKIVSTVLKCEMDDIDMTTGLLRHQCWDSLVHISIIVSIEREFQINIPENEVESLINIKKLCDYVNNHEYHIHDIIQ